MYLYNFRIELQILELAAITLTVLFENAAFDKLPQ